MHNTNNQYCLNLILGFEINSNILKTLTVDTSRVNTFIMHDIDQHLVEFLDKLDITIPLANIFYIPPWQILPLHGDLDEDLCKLNFVFGNKGSQMQWWKLKENNKSITRYENAMGTSSSRIEVKDCDFVWQQEVEQPGLINASIPHQVINCTSSPRWCMSFCLRDKTSHKPLLWAKAAKIFNLYCKQ